MNDHETRDLLYDHVYGVLEEKDERELRARLAKSAELREELDRVKAETDLLAEAARMESPDLVLTPPRSGRLRSLRRWATFAAAAAVLVAVGFAVNHARVRSNAVDLNPVIELAGPNAFSTDSPTSFKISARTLDGDPLAMAVEIDLQDRTGRVLDNKKLRTGPDGVATYTVAADLGRSGDVLDLRVVGLPDDARPIHLGSFEVRSRARLLARVSTDKPLYRPGDLVRIRAVALERFALTPAGSVPVNLRLEDPQGSVVHESTLSVDHGVGGWQVALDTDAVGGEYRVALSQPDGSFPEVVRTFRVMRYRAPRMKFDVTLDRDSYGRGGGGSAAVSVRRIEGGVPEGAKLTTSLVVNGVEVATRLHAVPASGSLVIPFDMPKDAENGRVSLSLRVVDGGNVATHLEPVRLTLDHLEIEWFPEGGDLVAGLESRMYFRVRDGLDEPADLMADVLDSGGATVATARVDTRGMGRFMLRPTEGEIYRLVARRPSGVELVGTFPDVKPSGVTLRSSGDVVRAGKAIRVKVASTSAGPHEVVAFCRGRQIATARVDLEAGRPAVVSLQPTEAVGGVARITVFAPNSLPVAERLVAMNPPRKLRLRVETSAAAYAPGERVRLKFVSTDETGRGVPALLGASVVDQATLTFARDEDTPSLPLHFLVGLEVDELEHVETFTGGPDAARAVDLLLGVQGWRRFAWKDTETFVADHPERGPRVVAVDGARDLPPESFTNHTRAESRVTYTVRRADRKFREVSAALGILGFFLLALVVGVVGAAKRERGKAIFGFAVVGLYALVAVTASTRLGGRLGLDTMAPASVAQRVFDAGDGAEMEEAWDDGGQVWHFTKGTEVEKFLDDGFLVDSDSTNGYFTDRDPVLVVAKTDGIPGSTATTEFRSFGGRRGWFSPPSRTRGLTDSGDATSDRNDDGRVTATPAGQFTFPGPFVLCREYAHARRPDHDGSRKDFAQTLYWNPFLVTDDNGEATVEFDTSDAITSFQVSVEGHDSRGGLGVGGARITNRSPFFVEPKLPVELATGDELVLPVLVVNNTNDDMPVHFDLLLSGGIGPTSSFDLKGLVDVGASTRSRALFRLTAGNLVGAASVQISATAPHGFSDRTTRPLTIAPRGYPVEFAAGGIVKGHQTTQVLLPDAFDRETLTGSLRVYPSVLATIVNGLEGMIRMPGGCFEQTSSTNYPNVLALTFLDDNGLDAPRLAKKSRDYLEHGYELLTSYECDEGGFEWFGAGPGHEALTAYGLMQFHDMDKVFDVDPDMVDRTRKWLHGRRDGQGGFLRNEEGYHAFGQCSRKVWDTYITWALTESDPDVDLGAELATVATRAGKSRDPYLLALAANALVNRRHPDAGRILSKLGGLQTTGGGFEGDELSVTSSGGENLAAETTALAALAFLRAESHTGRAAEAVRFLVEHRRAGGTFGSTQATVLALKAIIAFAKTAPDPTDPMTVRFRVGDHAIGERRISPDALGTVVLGAEFLEALKPGANTVRIDTDSDHPLTFGLAVGLHTDLPADHPDCAVELTTALAKTSAAEGETVGLRALISNRTAQSLPMTLARIGYPAGLEPTPAGLEALQNLGDVAYVETRAREITLYFRGLAAGATKTVDIDLVAAIPGKFEGPASSAYLYYTDERKVWAAPLTIEISPAE